MKDIATNIIASIIVSLFLAVVITVIAKILNPDWETLKLFISLLVPSIITVPALYWAWRLWRSTDENTQGGAK